VFEPVDARPELAWQPGLLGLLEEPEPDPGFGGLRHRALDEDCWIDHVPGWLAGSDTVFADLLASAAWKAREVVMYDHVVAEPRLTARWSTEPPPVLARIRDALSARYRVRFDAVGVNLYRDGEDSVAWHRDRVRRLSPKPLVATITLGATRRFLLRPHGGGPAVAFAPAAGDLLVMGGAMQQHWEHCVPKTRRPIGPRMAITVRHVHEDAPEDQ
jgi:alkylated DNA repair dioxygenase AlkB